jgi:hypothetical protein
MTGHAYELASELAASWPNPLAVAIHALEQRISLEVERHRARGAITLDELRGLYASEERVERILARQPRESLFDGGHEERSTGMSLGDGALSEALLVLPAWRALARELAPSSLERDLVLLALARELRLDHEIVFGFLNDDLTRRWPTRELALRLLAASDDDRTLLRAALGERAPLVAHGVLSVVEEGEHRSWLAGGVAITPLAAALLADAGDPETRLPAGVTRVSPRSDWSDEVPEVARTRLARIVRGSVDDEAVPLVVLEGSAGSGRTRLAMNTAAMLECSLLRVDVHIGHTGADPQAASRRIHDVERALSAALLWQRLAGAVVLLDGTDDWFPRDDSIVAPPRPLLSLLEHSRGPVAMRLEPGARWHAALGELRVASVELSRATPFERAEAWRRAVDCEAPRARLAETDALALADRFDLTPGRIGRVVRRAADEGALDHAPNEMVRSDDVMRRLSEAARAETRDALGALAARAATPHGWEHLVLPITTMERLRDFSAAIRDRALVLDQWGFGRRATRARGISALFAGASGTGKTMAASVIARELGLDLFVIDLSGVVSKYIGETERNLDKVFRSARDAGAILFFDEADALFGKRSEVKDARDRYANIEVAYLLQQLDIHDGPVVLATNLSRNLDAAFSRRMRYVIEFPLPGEGDRLRVWRGIFPDEAPLAADVDLEFLAANFALAGGDIRNVALDAAYLAAAECSTIGMSHLVRAMARQLAKQGKTPSIGEFRHYVALLDRDA